jgi:hypothetical protein
VLDGFQPRERIDASNTLRCAGREGPAVRERPGERRTGTVMKTVPVEALARLVLG